MPPSEVHDLGPMPAAAWLDPLPRPQPWTGKATRWSRLDRLSHLALATAHEALARAGGLRSDGETGLVFATAFGAHLPNELFLHGLRRLGPLGASPAMFAYTLASSAAGEVSIGLGLRGPLMVLAQGATSGLAALGEASALVDQGRAGQVLAGAADTLGRTLLLAAGAAGPQLSEGAVFFCVQAGTEGALARLAGEGQASGADALDRARAAALDRAGLTEAALRADPLRRDGDGAWPAHAILLDIIDLLSSPGLLPARVSVLDRGGHAHALCLGAP